MNKGLKDISYLIKSSSFARTTGAVASVCLMILLVATVAPVYTKPAQVEAAAGTATASTLTFTSTSSTASVNLNVNSADGTFATSSDGSGINGNSNIDERASFSISTNNYTGYTLKIKSSACSTVASCKLGDTFPSIESDKTASNFTTNAWGYLPNYYNATGTTPAVNTTTYYPAPTTTGTTLRVTDVANSTAHDYTISLGLKADYTNASGTYAFDSGTFVLEYVANPVAYSISFADNTGDASVANIPSTTLAGSTSDTTVTLPATIPTRTGYTFSKWCLGTVSNNGTTCTGTQFSAGGSFGIDQTASSNSATLYALWTINTYAITFTFGTGISDIVIKDSTETNTIATISSSGNSVNLTYGVTYKIVPTFTGDYELNAMTKTTGSGTLSGTSFTVGTGTATINITGKVDLCKGKTTLYDLVACRSKGKQTNDTNATTGIKASITAANSGVYEYDATVFGAASDAANTSAIYYYRGVLDETTGSYGSDGDGKAWPNYVKLANNTCWRIVRTTGSGGVKMVYNGVYGDTTAGSCANAQTKAQTRYNNADLTVPFNTSSSSKAGKTYTGLQYQNMHAIGYTYSTVAASTTTDTALGALLGSSGNDTTTNSKSSIIKQYIEDWYASNLSSYTSMLEPSAGYCNDRTVYPSGSYAASDKLSENTQVKPYGTSGMTVYYFGAYTRNMNTAQTPTLNCPRGVVDLYSTTTASGGNGQLSQPVALLTADEMSFSGSGSSTASNGSGYNAKSFLRSGSNFWLLSPYNRHSIGNASGFNLSSNGYLNGSYVSSARGVRPAISLTSGTTAASGSGTATDPWVVTAP